MEPSALQRMRTVLPHLRVAAEDAAAEFPDGRVLLAIIVRRPDGSGMVVCDFEGDEFIADLAAVCGP